MRWHAVTVAALLLTSLPAAAQNTPGDLATIQLLSEFRENLEKADTHGVVSTLAAAFPEDYAAFELDMLARYRAGDLSEGEAEQLGHQFTSDLVQRNLSLVKSATPAQLKTLSSARVQTLTVLMRGHVAACHEYVESDLSAQRASEIGLDGADALAVLGRKVVDIVTAPAANAAHPQPEDAEWEAVGVRYVELGGHPIWINALFSDQDFNAISHTTRCESALAWERAIYEAPDHVTAAYISSLYTEAPKATAPADGVSG